MSKDIDLCQIIKYSDKYDEGVFWSALRKVCSAVGKTVVGKVLQLYYVLQRNDVPTSEKALIMGALAYLVSSIDVVPDCIPLVGWADDIAAIGYVLTKMSKYVNAKVNAQANRKLEEIFD